MNPASNAPELPLRDIHLPMEPSWWPPAPGWWLLAVIVLALFVLAARKLWQEWRRHRRRQALLREFDRAVAAADPGGAPILRLRAAMDLLRRVVRRDAPQALGLRDDDWLAYLDQGMPGRPFSSELREVLQERIYAADIEPDTAEAALRAIRLRLQRGLP